MSDPFDHTMDNSTFDDTMSEPSLAPNKPSQPSSEQSTVGRGEASSLWQTWTRYSEEVCMMLQQLESRSGGNQVIF